MPSAGLKTSDDSHNDDHNEKKLWIDYLAKLRDREDRSNQVTGATNWVLCALMGTLFYKAIESFPLAFADKDYRYNTYILVILGFNLLVSGQTVLSEFLPRIKKPDSDIRALPEKLERLLVGYSAVLAIFLLMFGSIELIVGYQNIFLARLVRLLLFGFGALHIILGFTCGAFFYIKRKFDRVRQGILPQLMGESLRGALLTNLLWFAASCAFLASIVTHLHSVMYTSPTWLLSIKSAFGILVFFWAAYKLVVLRPNRAQVIDEITELERQALVENLSASEIKERFNELTLGVRLRQWVQESSESVSNVWEDIATYLDSISHEVEMACSSSPSNDKLENLQGLKKRIEKYAVERDKQVYATVTQSFAAIIINWAFGRTTSKETMNKIGECKKNIDQLALRTKELFRLLDTEINQTVGQINTLAKHATPQQFH